MTKIYTYAKFAIHDGKAEEFKSLVRECSEIVNRDEPGTLFYEWFLSSSETECVAFWPQGGRQQCETGTASALHHCRRRSYIGISRRSVAL